MVTNAPEYEQPQDLEAQIDMADIVHNNKRGIAAYLDGLTLEQLKTAKSLADQEIKKRTEGNRIGYWEVYSGQFPTEYFPYDQYQNACDRVTEIMRSNANVAELLDFNKNVQLDFQMDYASELPYQLKPKAE